MENYFFLENYVTSEEAVSHTVLYYQPLPITRYQVKSYANNCFELLPIVSTAFNAIWYDLCNVLIIIITCSDLALNTGFLSAET